MSTTRNDEHSDSHVHIGIRDIDTRSVIIATPRPLVADVLYLDPKYSGITVLSSFLTSNGTYPQQDVLFDLEAETDNFDRPNGSYNSPGNSLTGTLQTWSQWFGNLQAGFGPGFLLSTITGGQFQPSINLTYMPGTQFLFGLNLDVLVHPLSQDVYSEMQVANLSAGTDWALGLWGRVSGLQSGNDFLHAYKAVWNGDGTFQLERVLEYRPGFTVINLSQVVYGPVSSPINVGDILRVECRGSYVTPMVNGTPVVEFFDSYGYVADSTDTPVRVTRVYGPIGIEGGNYLGTRVDNYASGELTPYTLRKSYVEPFHREDDLDGRLTHTSLPWVTNAFASGYTPAVPWVYSNSLSMAPVTTTSPANIVWVATNFLQFDIQDPRADPPDLTGLPNGFSAEVRIAAFDAASSAVGIGFGNYIFAVFTDGEVGKWLYFYAGQGGTVQYIIREGFLNSTPGVGDRLRIESDAPSITPGQPQFGDNFYGNLRFFFTPHLHGPAPHLVAAPKITTDQETFINDSLVNPQALNQPCLWLQNGNETVTPSDAVAQRLDQFIYSAYGYNPLNNPVLWANSTMIVQDLSEMDDILFDDGVVQASPYKTEQGD